MKPTNPILLTPEELSELLSIGRPRISDLTKAGVFAKAEDGRCYDLWPTVRAYTSRFKRKSQHDDEGGDSGEQVADYHAERALLTRAKRRKEEILADIAEGRAVQLDDAIEAATRIGAAVAARIKKLRADLPPMLEGLTPQQMTRVIAKETDKLLSSLSDATSEIYTKKES